MNITRLNYENYFLLYVDGELSSVEMQAVDSFATENNDLADELNMLLQTKLPAELYHFENKSSLHRTNSDHINNINCEEQFLLFVDGELTEQDKKEIMVFVSNHPQYQELFETIQQTKLPIEQLSFPNKDALYRKEENTKPVIIMQWWKLAVAAAVIGIFAMVGIFMPRNNTTSLTKLKVAPKNLSRSIKVQPNLLQIKIKEQNQFVQSNKVVPNKSILPSSEKNNSTQPILVESVVAKVVSTKLKDSAETIASNTNNTIVYNNQKAINNDNNHASLLTPVNNQTDEVTNRNIVKSAVYKELDTDDERKSLYVGSVEINKDKLRGFLRKASSLFKGRNKSEEEKTEISNSHTLE
jgi:hypothetical protein